MLWSHTSMYACMHESTHTHTHAHTHTHTHAHAHTHTEGKKSNFPYTHKKDVFSFV